MKASPPFFSPSPCPFSCIHSISNFFGLLLQTSHPFTQLINYCLNNITALPFSCVRGPGGTFLLITKAGRDFHFHPLQGHEKCREQDPACLAGQAFMAVEQLADTAHPRESCINQTWPLWSLLHIYSTCRAVYVPQRWELEKKSTCRIYQLFKSYCYLLYRSNLWPLNWILTVVRQIREAVREGRDWVRGLS